MARQLDLNPNRFVIFASLLGWGDSTRRNENASDSSDDADSHNLALMCFAGNHILPDEDLAAFHWSLLGPEHPLASLKVSRSFVYFLTVTEL